MSRPFRAAALLIFWAGTTVAAGIDFEPFRLPTGGHIVLPVAEGESLTGLAREVDEQTGGALAIAAAEAAFTGEKNTILALYGLKPYGRIDLIGVGPDRLDRVAAEDFGGLAAAAKPGTSGNAVRVLWAGIDRDEDATAARVAFGYRLGSYRFDRYLSEPEAPTEPPQVTILSDDASALDFDEDLAHLADAVGMARDLASEPGNVIYPESFAERVAGEFRGLDGVRVHVLDEKDLARRGMGAHLGVGSGSERPPRLLVIEYGGGGSEAPVVLAGKGITFDSGGTTLKRNDGMWRMKADLSGAAVVSATVLAAARRGAAMNVVALAALAENMPSGSAIRPGDVLKTASGKTIEIRSTDAEGRLVLSDAVHYAQVEYSPAVLIDVATLTGSVGRALGTDYGGLFSRHDDLVAQLLAAAAAAGEEAWRLPLNDRHFEALKSPIADVMNSDVDGPGASTGAAFIGTFVDENLPWAHLDIAGVDYLEKARPTVPAGFSAWGVRALDEFLRRHHGQDGL